MKPSMLLASLVASRAAAHPAGAFDSVVRDIQARDTYIEERSMELIGDVARGALSAVGQIIKSILQGAIPIDGGSPYPPPGQPGSQPCNRDACCKWTAVVSDMMAAFADAQGCTDLARAAIRAGFHDSFPWDRASNTGGADGSLVLSDEEFNRPENNGLEAIGDQLRQWQAKHNVGMADLIQMAATTAVVSCPGGPRIRSFVGRIDNSAPNQPNQIPAPFFDAQTILDMFTARSFNAADLVALVGAHTVSRQQIVDPARAGTPQDSTPSTWDTNFYSETLTSDNSTLVTFFSDKNISSAPPTADQFKAFAAPGAQAAWAKAFASAYFRMSMLGVNNMNKMTECTKVLPRPR